MLLDVLRVYHCFGEDIMQHHRHLIVVPVLVTGLFLSLPASDLKRSGLHKNSSGVEVRVNLVGSSGRFVQDYTVTAPDGNVLQTYTDRSDLTSKGGSLQIGYARDYVRRDQYSFIYVGYESQTWNDDYDSVFHAFLVGLEGGVGSRTFKFIYGGEFGFGALDTGSEGVGYLNTFSAEPYIGLKYFVSEDFSLNLRMGVRSAYVEAVTDEEGINTRTSQNSAYTANGQIGLGYRFY